MKKIKLLLIALFAGAMLVGCESTSFTDKSSESESGIEKRNNGSDVYYVYKKYEELEDGKVYIWLNQSKGTEPELSNNMYGFYLFEIENEEIKNNYPSAIFWIPDLLENVLDLYGKEEKWSGFDAIESMGLEETSRYDGVLGWATYDDKINQYVCHRMYSYSFKKKLSENPTLEDVIEMYCGYRDMVSKGFDKSMLKGVTTAKEFYEITYTYINDNHFTAEDSKNHYYNGDFGHKKEIVYTDGYSSKVSKNDILTDENIYKNQDKEDWYVFYGPANKYRKVTFKEQKSKHSILLKTPEYDYSFQEEGKDYFYIYTSSFAKDFHDGKLLTQVFDKCKNKKYIIIDVRSNHGGGDVDSMNFFDKLESINYKGKIYVIQNRYSCSAGEGCPLNARYNYEDYSQRKLDVTIIGENTYGMCAWADWILYEVGDVTLRMPSHPHPAQGVIIEGCGIIPDIFCTDEDLKEFMKNLTGLDLPVDKLY